MEEVELKEAIVVVTALTPKEHRAELEVRDRPVAESIETLLEGTDGEYSPLHRTVHWRIERRGARTFVHSRLEVTEKELAQLREDFNCSVPAVREITIESDVTDTEWSLDDATPVLLAAGIGEMVTAKILGLDTAPLRPTIPQSEDDKLRLAFAATAKYVRTIPTALRRIVIGLWRNDSGMFVGTSVSPTEDPRLSVATIVAYLQFLGVESLSDAERDMLTMRLRKLAAHLRGQQLLPDTSLGLSQGGGQ